MLYGFISYKATVNPNRKPSQVIALLYTAVCIVIYNESHYVRASDRLLNIMAFYRAVNIATRCAVTFSNQHIKPKFNLHMALECHP